MSVDRRVAGGWEKRRFYYCSIRKSGIIARRHARKFVPVIRAISISLDAINLDCAFIGATNYHHYSARAIAALLAKQDY